MAVRALSNDRSYDSHIDHGNHLLQQGRIDDARAAYSRGLYIGQDKLSPPACEIRARFGLARVHLAAMDRALQPFTGRALSQNDVKEVARIKWNYMYDARFHLSKAAALIEADDEKSHAVLAELMQQCHQPTPAVA